MNITNNIQITNMTLQDLKQITPILTTDFDNFWTPTILEQEINYENSKYIIAKSNQQILGFAGIRITFDQADIMNIVVHKNFRNQKIGTLLLENLIQTCKDLNLTNIILEVNEKNSNAISLYEKFNFKQISTRKNYYKNNKALILQKTLHT